MAVSCRVLNVDLGTVVETVLPPRYQVGDAMTPILSFLKTIKFRRIVVSYMDSKFGLAAMPDLSSAPGINDIFQVCLYVFVKLQSHIHAGNPHCQIESDVLMCYQQMCHLA